MKARHSPKSQKLVLLILPLLAVVMISGCTSTGGGATFGPGVVILNWEPTFSAVEEGDSVQFRLRMQNQGEVTATSVDPQIIGITPEDWQISTYSGGFLGSSELVPPDRFRNTEGQIRQDTYDAVAPDLPRGTTQTFTPQIRVYYHYRTTASKLVTLVNDQELKRLQDKGQTLSSKDTISSSGPLKVTVNAGKFIKAKEMGGVSRAFPISIEIQNVGGGVVSTRGASANDYQVGFNMPTTNSGRLNIGNCLTGGSSYAGSAVTLWKGQSATVTCTATISSSLLASEEVNMMIVLEYDYYIDASTSVTVTGNELGMF